MDTKTGSGLAVSPALIAEHELFHANATEEMLRTADDVVRESMTAEEYDAMRDAYKADYAGVYDFANMSVDEIERLLTEEIAADAYAGLNWFSGDAPVQEAVRAETERNAPAQRAEAQQETTGPPEGKAQAFVGYDEETGRGIYRSNFEENTPKAQKSERVIRLIQDVWSKNPIDLVVENEDGSKSIIKAEFDPDFDEVGGRRSDASKLAGGNRHGTASEKRVTLNLADDFYRIIQESTYSRSKAETGKASETHTGVNTWRYFVNPILYMERSGSEMIPYTVSIDVKQKDNGNFVYSFHAERDVKNNGQPAPQTLHAAVNGAENDTANGLPIKESIADTVNAPALTQTPEAPAGTASFDPTIRSNSGKSQEKSSGRASVAGINARTADSAALRRAEALEKSGTDNETIRQETGWYRGRDGKWRFEIDDSGMKTRKAYVSEREKTQALREYTARFKNLTGDGLTNEQRGMLREYVSQRERGEFSDKTYQQLTDMLGDEFENFAAALEGKMSASAGKNDLSLAEYINHPKLFEAYPALKNVTVRFDSLPDGQKGYFSKRDNTIVLSDSLFGEETDVVLHELQHVIQNTEGFTGGASPQYWNREATYNEATEKYRDNRARLLHGLSAEERALYDEYRSTEREMGAMLDGSMLYDESRMDELEKRSDELYRELYGKEWFGKLNRYDRILGDASEAVKEFYWNTAGEIEARDTAACRRMTTEERKKTPLDLGDADTVFADGTTAYSINENFKKDVDDWLKNTSEDMRSTSPGYFRVGTTSEALQSIGARTDNIYMRKSKIGTILEEHPEVDAGIIKSVPNVLENPVLVMKSLTRPDSIVVFGEEKARNGSNLMVALELTPKPGGRTEMEFSLVTSAYGRSDANVQNLINNSELLYLDTNKNRANSWLMQLRVQFPSRQPPYGSIGNIAYAKDGVKITGKNYRSWAA